MWERFIAGFSELAFASGFMPHGHCYLWQPEVMWLHALSDAVIAAAYFSIPFALLRFMRLRKDLAFRRVFAMFGIFILSCGLTHVFSIIDIWYPLYWAEGGVKALTAVASLATAVVMWPLIPRAVALPSPGMLEVANRELERQIGERKVAEAALQAAHDRLEARVLERTTELRETNGRLSIEIDERKQTEGELAKKNAELEQEVQARQEAELQYRELFAQSPDGLLLIDALTLELVRWNPATNALLGRSDEELSHRDLRTLEAESQLTGIVEHTLRVRETEGALFETEYRARGGDVRHLAVALHRVAMAGRRLVLCILRDTTARKQLENEVQKAQKLESIGLLAGGIAHDFNNFLMIVVGNISLAQESVAPESEAGALLSECGLACERAQGLTRQLLTFAKGGAPVKATTSIAEVVKESALFAVRGSRARCEYSAAADLWLGEIDAGQITQVVCNLVINAIQAMPSGGTVTVRCENVPVADGAVPGLAAGDYVRVAVADTGVGIPADRLPKIFDPYFTTKQQGSGLGLASAYSIVKRHGGHIDVRSIVDVGTTFFVYLPAATGASAAARARESARAKNRPLRVLVMDDEGAIRDMITKMLRRLGHTVETVADGDSAIRAYAAALPTDAKFDVVLLDLTIAGGIGGREVAVRLLELDPNVKAIASSGYAGDGTTGEFTSLGFVGALTKPYDTKALERALSAAVGR